MCVTARSLPNALIVLKIKGKNKISFENFINDLGKCDFTKARNVVWFGTSNF